MVAGYLQADGEAMFSMLNEMAIFVFSAANMLWLLGMIGVCALEAGGLRVAEMALSAIGGAAFAAMFFGLIGEGRGSGRRCSHADP